MNNDFDEEAYYAQNAIEGSARLRDAILNQVRGPAAIVWVEPEGAYFARSHQSISHIQDEVAEYFHVSPDTMTEASGLRALARPRQIAMYMAREVLGASFPKIGRHFGHRDHTTAVHACNAVRKRMAVDPTCRADVEALRERLAA